MTDNEKQQLADYAQHMMQECLRAGNTQGYTAYKDMHRQLQG